MPPLTTNLFFQYKCYSFPIFYKHTDTIDKSFVYRQRNFAVSLKLHWSFLQSHDPYPILHNPKVGTLQTPWERAVIQAGPVVTWLWNNQVMEFS